MLIIDSFMMTSFFISFCQYIKSYSYNLCGTEWHYLLICHLGTSHAHAPATLSARSATGCVVHGLGFLPTTSPTRDDETRRIDGSVFSAALFNHGCATFYKTVMSVFAV